ncbi:sensor histidine kinase [Paraburkholderia domus]|uniref:histidine kinase n=1 Tax=Paraburkholderia domus TaxID=2793075 RepID=A0A9N8R276_9BURK|nr:sensor histidine kinase [Paraburkholderia domus]MBK5168883.1 sensor histidine kinase N-terminal domain-containing protein [Burkholderia sp. R-70211]MBK5182545.1 sensor histidine kinase N-terminal domain-containing protein [Burkholderia sp. R-69749]MCI0150411.1 sensor histidine kinase N-terminal domain-containing protein [Paraburkholderia sediminicola]CAE6847082.1 Sensor protein QseC [Paraburkholderia domus]CAE6898695.1 Sensor protein QseC [Paraburkholderia domus]
MTRPNLRVSVALWLLLPLLLLLAFDAWLTYQRAMNAAHVAFDRTLEFSLRSIRDGIRLRDGQIEVDLPYLALEMFESNGGGNIYYQIREEGGRVVTGYPDLPSGTKAPADPYSVQFYDDMFRGRPLRIAMLRLPVHDVPSAQTRVVLVSVGETIEQRQALAREILTGSLQQEFLLVVLALGIVWLGVARGLRPLNRLSAKVAARAEDDPTPLDTVGLPSEVAPLVDSINQYIGRTQLMQLSRRRFFNDAAHQLKTPLAVIQAESELALRDIDGGDEVSNGSRRQGVHLRRLNRAVQQAVRIVQQLLSLSRLDADSGYTVKHAAVPLHKVARSVTLDWSPVARSRGIDLGFEQDARIDVMGQTDLLAELVGNLIDNAIRYSGDGAVITVRVACEGEQPLLQVIDNGPGIAVGERDAVFERFYRSEATQAVEGSGLGLSIVREIARVHGALIALSDAPGGGLVVSVQFPALRAA